MTKNENFGCYFYLLFFLFLVGRKKKKKKMTNIALITDYYYLKKFKLFSFFVFPNIPNYSTCFFFWDNLI